MRATPPYLIPGLAFLLAGCAPSYYAVAPAPVYYPLQPGPTYLPAQPPAAPASPPVELHAPASPERTGSSTAPPSRQRSDEHEQARRDNRPQETGNGAGWINPEPSP
jgi:hypothetical protein